ncbi:MULTISPECIES: hypothetical protein [Hymenobacter]|uniref:Uncharacterized protein n=2 Tax=Hymenobacter TaxID=89966 RepID=A0ABS6X071_9BACT|nr:MULTISPECIES: hypothetical protein [Hymenobacter]MBO3269862.1 hypothetical protein [Hymenobacter defluvii]MBW3129245.1 hypothetical protein [Hymenobacter profundi]
MPKLLGVLALLLSAALLVRVLVSTSTYLMAPPAAPTASLATGNTIGYLLALALAALVSLWLGRWGIRRLRR